MASRKFVSYLRDLHARRPVIINTAAFSLLYAAGDVSQQTITQKPKYDLENTARIAAVGGGFGGPFYYYWYRYLDRRIPATTAKAIIKKLACDQAVAGICGTFIFYTGIFLFSNEDYKFHSFDLYSEMTGATKVH